jgi:hypothetical protein
MQEYLFTIPGGIFKITLHLEFGLRGKGNGYTGQ